MDGEGSDPCCGLVDEDAAGDVISALGVCSSASFLADKGGICRGAAFGCSNKKCKILEAGAAATRSAYARSRLLLFNNCSFH